MLDVWGLCNWGFPELDWYAPAGQFSQDVGWYVPGDDKLQEFCPDWS